MDFNMPKKTSSFKTPSTGSSLMSNEPYQELMAFKKAAKRDISAFNILKDEKYYDVFHRSFKATAMTQGLSDVCDPNFKPKRGDPHEQHLFTENKTWFMLYCSRPSKLIMAEPLSENTSMTKMLSRSCMSSINTIQTLNYPELRSYSSPPMWPTSSSQTIGEEPPLNSFSISKNNSGFWIALILWMNNSLTPPGWHSCSELWKVFLTSEESGSWMV